VLPRVWEEGRGGGGGGGHCRRSACLRAYTLRCTVSNPAAVFRVGLDASEQARGKGSTPTKE
jgi:hypothetical protein